MPISVPLGAVLAAVGIHVLWGGNPVALKLALEVFPPMWAGFARFVLGVASILAWAAWRGIRVWPTRAEWPILGWIGILFSVQIATMNLGLDLTTGAMGAVLIATNPVFAVLFTHFLMPDDRLTLGKTAGLALAFVGTALVLLRGGGVSDLSLVGWGNWITLLSAALLGLRLALSARALQAIDPVRVAVWQMIISLPFFAVGGLAFEQIRWERIDWMPIGGLLYQGVVIAGLAFMVNFQLIQRYQPSVVVSFNFVSPVAGVLLSAWLLDETVGTGLTTGMLLVAAGLYFVARRRAPARR